jgi:hypothetical protein
MTNVSLGSTTPKTTHLVRRHAKRLPSRIRVNAPEPNVVLVVLALNV